MSHFESHDQSPPSTDRKRWQIDPSLDGVLAAEATQFALGYDRSRLPDPLSNLPVPVATGTAGAITQPTPGESESDTKHLTLAERRARIFEIIEKIRMRKEAEDRAANLAAEAVDDSPIHDRHE